MHTRNPLSIVFFKFRYCKWMRNRHKGCLWRRNDHLNCQSFGETPAQTTGCWKGYFVTLCLTFYFMFLSLKWQTFTFMCHFVAIIQISCNLVMWTTTDFIIGLDIWGKNFIFVHIVLTCLQIKLIINMQPQV